MRDKVQGILCKDSVMLAPERGRPMLWSTVRYLFFVQELRSGWGPTDRYWMIYVFTDTCVFI